MEKETWIRTEASDVSGVLIVEENRSRVILRPSYAQGYSTKSCPKYSCIILWSLTEMGEESRERELKTIREHP